MIKAWPGSLYKLTRREEKRWRTHLSECASLLSNALSCASTDISLLGTLLGDLELCHTVTSSAVLWLMPAGGAVILVDLRKPRNSYSLSYNQSLDRRNWLISLILTSKSLRSNVGFHNLNECVDNHPIFRLYTTTATIPPASEVSNNKAWKWDFPKIAESQS